MNLTQLLDTFKPQTPDFSLQTITLQVILLLICSTILSVVYKRFGNSLSNRSRLARIFPLMTLTTMLIISIIKSSLALSLGLVGALSIVRFRAAIKDPEELAYIFLSIALGLGFGANQVGITLIFFVIILLVIIGYHLIKHKFLLTHHPQDTVHLELTFSSHQSLEPISQLLSQHNHTVKLTRFTHDDTTQAMFLIRPHSLKSLDTLQQQLLKLDQHLKINILHYQPLV